MPNRRIDFDSLDWIPMAPGARHKVVERGGKRVRLIEFTDAFVEEGWCPKGHSGVLLEGLLEIEFDNRVERYRAGEGIMTAGGGAEKHKARALSPVARLLVVEDV